MLVLDSPGQEQGLKFLGGPIQTARGVLLTARSEIEKTRIPRWVLLDSGYTPKPPSLLNLLCVIDSDSPQS